MTPPSSSSAPACAFYFILAVYVLLYTLHCFLQTPFDALRLLRLTGDSQYFSRGEMMSTRSLCLRNSTKITFPRPLPHSHESPTHCTAAIACFSPFLALSLHFTTYSHYFTLPRGFHAVTFIARSPVGRSANICYVVIFRRPYPSPHRLCCVFSICFTFYFAFSPLLHVPHLFSFYIQIITYKVGIKTR